MGSTPRRASRTVSTSAGVTLVAAAIASSDSVRKPFSSSAPIDVLGHLMQAGRQQGPQRPVEVLLQREFGLGPRDRIEVVGLVPQGPLPDRAVRRFRRSPGGIAGQAFGAMRAR